VRILWDGDTAEFLVSESLLPVFVGYDPAMLPVVESLLAANRIPFVVANETTQDILGLGRVAWGYNAAIGPPELRVAAAHVAAARELIASAVPVPAEDGTPGE